MRNLVSHGSEQLKRLRLCLVDLSFYQAANLAEGLDLVRSPYQSARKRPQRDPRLVRLNRLACLTDSRCETCNKRTLKGCGEIKDSEQFNADSEFVENVGDRQGRLTC